MPSPTEQRFAGTQFVLRKKMLKIFGGGFRIHAEDGSVAFYSKLKAFKLKDDLRIYDSEAMGRELIRIAGRNVIDIGATFDVFDSQSGERIGSLKRMALKSLVRDEWTIMDAAGQPVGKIVDPRAVLSLLRRFIPYLTLIPQKFVGTMHDRHVLTFRQLFNPFIHRVALDYSPDQTGLLDRRLGLAAGVLLCAVEGHGGG